MSWDTGLDGPALEFAGATEARIRSLAGPGTGKTFGLMRRVHRLLEGGAKPERLLVVTLTRTAASDLLGELKKLDVPGSDKVRACTLHSLCFQILSQEDVLSQTHRVPRILSKFERKLLLKDLRRELGTLTEKERLLRSYLSAWASLNGDPLGSPASGLPKEFIEEFLDYLRWHRCLLVGELVPIARVYLEQNPGAPALRWFDHVLVDEYQDLNVADQHIVELLAENTLTDGRGQLAVVGDDDQAIYVMLRNARPSGIVDFAADRNVVFSECRRCPTRVVAMAQSLIEHNRGRNHDPLTPASWKPPGDVHNVVFATMDDEADALAAFIDARISSGRAKPGDILVLANWRQVAYRIRDRLLALGRPAHSYFQEQALDADAAKEALTLVTLLADPGDRVALRCWLALKCKREARAAYARLYQAAAVDGTDVRAVLAALAAGSRRLPHTSAAVEAWVQLERRLANLRQAARCPLEILDTLVPAGEPDLLLLREAGLRAIELLEDPDDVAEFSGGIRKQIGMPEVPLEADFVRVMSLHKSKGLKAKLVVIAGLVQGLVPKSPDEDLDGAELEEHFREQRRVFYVGITRAMDELVLSKFEVAQLHDVMKARITVGSWAGKGVKRCIASQFMDELGPESPRCIRGDFWSYD